MKQKLKEEKKKREILQIYKTNFQSQKEQTFKNRRRKIRIFWEKSGEKKGSWPQEDVASTNSTLNDFAQTKYN